MRELRPELYRQLALYLQVMRKGLLHEVQQACFHLATQVHPERYGGLAAIERSELHQRLHALTQRCTSLLTIEQLAHLGRQLEREEQEQRQQRQASILASLEVEDGPEEPSLPDGSVRLGMDLPLSAELFSDGFAGLAGLEVLPGFRTPGERADQYTEEQEAADEGDDDDSPGATRFAGPPFDASAFGFADLDLEGPEDSELDDLEAMQDDPDDLFDEPSGSDPEAGPESGEDAKAPRARRRQEPWQPAHANRGLAGPPGEASQDLKLLQSLFTMAAETLGREPAADRPSGSGEANEREDGSPQDRSPQDGSSQDPSSPSDSTLMPSDPSALLRWWEAQDRALQRRLRNLSHAINVDLLRLRLTRSLMPVNLLDAVLQGQIEPLAAPANLLRLQLPFASPAGGLQLESLGVLVRIGDLEFRQPPLRTCRRRLERQRADLRKMAHLHRLWQRRLHALEAERQWLLDNNQVNPGPA